MDSDFEEVLSMPKMLRTNATAGNPDVSSDDSLSDLYSVLDTLTVKQLCVKDTCCRICHLTVSSNGQLRSHMKEFHPDAHPYTCDQCSGSYLTFLDLRAYERNIH